LAAIVFNYRCYVIKHSKHSGAGTATQRDRNANTGTANTAGAGTTNTETQALVEQSQSREALTCARDRKPYWRHSRVFNYRCCVIEEPSRKVTFQDEMLDRPTAFSKSAYGKPYEVTKQDAEVVRCLRIARIVNTRRT
jgi:hypothetical protein